jgi:TonB family protein
VTSQLWLHDLAAWSAQAAALIAAGSLAAGAFRLRVPRVRLAYCQALLAISLLLPAVEPWRNAADSRIDITTADARPAPSDHSSTHAFPWRRALLITLVAGAAARTLWLAVGLAKLRGWRQTAQPFSPLPPGLLRLRPALAPKAEFLQSASVSGPVTFGLFRPVVVLPHRFTELPPDIQEAVACHELLHVRRHDWIATVIEESIRAALWFHPAVWWLISQVQLAREQTVDRQVVEFTENRSQYLNALLVMAGNQPALDLAPATLFLRKRHLKNRVALLLKEVTMSKRTLISFCATSCALLFAAGWLALHTFPLEAAPAAPQEDSSKLLHSVAPRYPKAALEKRIEGPVVLEVQIDAEGHVADAHVLNGPEELRSAALEAVLQWHYSPRAMTLPATNQVTIQFRLPEDASSAKAAKSDGLLPKGKRVALQSVQVEGLSSTARDELLQSLPAHQGDTVDADALRSLQETVRAFDNHLRVSLSTPENNSATLRIFLPPADAPEERAQALTSNKIRVGAEVQRTKLLHKTSPIYPLEAKAQHIEGAVSLKATIGKDGKVENLQVLDGNPLLAAAALEAVKNWEYSTTLLNGDPVEVVTEITINFTLAK